MKMINYRILKLKGQLKIIPKFLSTTVYETEFEYDYDDKDYDLEILSKEYEKYKLKAESADNAYFRAILLTGSYRKLWNCFKQLTTDSSFHTFKYFERTIWRV